MSSRRVRSISPAVVPALLDWFHRHRRALPWRRDRDPYRVWVAEVLLQQTRVEQALPYYERFLSAFPSVEELARASEGSVLKAWQGAGYYARARNLRQAARRVVADHGGRVPATVPALEELPGVGPYIARAVASLAFGTPVVALEANGLRVGARWTREEGDLTRGRARARIDRALASVLPTRSPGAFNEALMELGETVCLPRRPRCEACPVARYCRARRELPDPGAIPRPRRRGRRPLVRAAVIALERGDRFLLQRRPSGGLLGGLWELPGGKIGPGERPETAARRELLEETGHRAGTLRPLGVVHHGYSHFRVELHVYRGRAAGPAPRRRPGARRWVTLADAGRLPLPKATERILALLGEGTAGRASPGSGSRRGRTRASTPRGSGSRARRSRVRGTAP